MKFTAEAMPLSNALIRVAEAAAGGANVVPMLSNVLLRAGTNDLTLIATDLERAITERLPVSVHAPGAATVSAKTLADAVRKMPAGAQISVGLDDDNVLHVNGGRARFKFSTLPVDEFPNWTDGEHLHRFNIDAVEMRRLIAKTEFAMCKEDARYYLCGIFLHVADGRLRAVATNGHLLARYDSIEAPEFPGVILSSGTVHILKRLLAKRGDEIEVELSPTKARFTIGSTVLTTKLIDGTFPDYVRVIPTDNNRELRVVTADLRAAIDRVAVMASPTKPGVKLELNGHGAVLSTRDHLDNQGSAVEELDATYDGSAFYTGFNAGYAKDIIDQIDSDEAVFRFDTPGSPILVPDGDTLFVLMPLVVT